MKYRNLGRTGVKVSELCLGTMQFGWTVDEKDSFSILSAAYEAGINFIDSADIYSRWAEGNPGGVSESIIGRWIKAERIPREKIILATKVRGRMDDDPNAEGLSRKHILDAVDKSLHRLQTDYIDLYQAHWFDEKTPVAETLRVFDDLIRKGTVRYIGCSNYPAWRLMEALSTSDRLNIAQFICLQPHYSLIHRSEFERELRAVCENFGLGVIPYSPLGGGFLTGKYQRNKPLPNSVRSSGIQQRYFDERNWVLLDYIHELAQVKSTNISAVALSWLLTDSVVTSPIIGPRTIQQLEENLAAVAIEISVHEKMELDRLSNWERE